MNICLVSCGFPPDDGGGIGTYSYNLAYGLKEKGHTVCVLTSTKGEDRVDEIEGITVYRFKYRYLPKLERFLPGLAYSFFICKTIRELDQKFNFDVIEFPNWEGIGLLYLLSLKRKPVVIRIHTPFFETLAIDVKDSAVSLGERFICWMEKNACVKSDRLVSSTYAHRRLIMREYNLPESKFSIVPLGIRLVGRARDPKFSTAEGGAKKILYVSRLERRKGTITLLDAIPGIVDRHPAVEFIFIGKDRPHAPGNKLFADYFADNFKKYADRVRFLGYVSDDDLRAYYADTDIFVVPSVYESFGLIYVEAMMHAKPVIGCKAGGIPEVVADGKTGILIEPEDVDGLVNAVSRLLEDETLCKTMGQQARVHCEEKFDVALMAQRTDAVYRETKDGARGK